MSKIRLTTTRIRTPGGDAVQTLRRQADPLPTGSTPRSGCGVKLPAAAAGVGRARAKATRLCGRDAKTLSIPTISAGCAGLRSNQRSRPATEVGGGIDANERLAPVASEHPRRAGVPACTTEFAAAAAGIPICGADDDVGFTLKALPRRTLTTRGSGCGFKGCTPTAGVDSRLSVVARDGLESITGPASCATRSTRGGRLSTQ